MKRISIFTIVLMVAALVIASTVSGGIPRTMNYQGRLTDAGGDPVSGTYYMTFEIYDAESDGTQLWAESKIVEVTDGIFTVTLGGTNSLDEADLMGNDCWLQFSVEGETIVPRTRLVSSPYSVTAGLADSVSAPLQLVHDGLDGKETFKATNSTSGNWGSTGGDTAGIYGYAASPDDYAIVFENDADGTYGYFGGKSNGGYLYNAGGSRAYLAFEQQALGYDIGVVGYTFDSDPRSVGVKGLGVMGSNGQLGGLNYAVKGSYTHDLYADSVVGGFAYVADPTGIDDSTVYGVYGCRGEKLNEWSISIGYLAGDSAAVYGEVSSDQDFSIAGLNSASGNNGHIGGPSYGVYGKNGNENKGMLGGEIYAIYGEYGDGSGPYGFIGSSDYAVHGTHASNNHGYLGGSDFGAYGFHQGSGAYGGLGSSTVGVYGEADNPSHYGLYAFNQDNYGYVAGGHHGVYGQNEGGQLGYLGGDTVGVYGEVSASTDFAVLGKHAGSGTTGYLGLEHSAVYGLTGLSSQYAVFGYNANGNYSYLGGDSVCVYGNPVVSYYWAAFLQGKVYMEGRVGIGTKNPAVQLHIDGGSDASVTSGGYVVVGDLSSSNIVIDNNEIMARNNGVGHNLSINSDAGNVYLCYDGGNVGIDYLNPTAKLAVDGDICYTGTIGACSDARYKKDVEDIKSALETVLELRGVTYSWKQDEYPERNFDDQTHLGFIAQELKDLLPGVVMEDADGYMSVDYSRLTPLLVEAVKEQQTTIGELKKQVEVLSDLVEKLLENREANAEDRDMSKRTILAVTVLIPALILMNIVFGGKIGKVAGNAGKSGEGETVVTEPATEDPSDGVLTPSSASSREPAAGEEINWQVISSGGTEGNSTNYNLSGTAAQTATGSGTSESYGLSHGFWQQFSAPVLCVAGDANYSGDVDIDDVVYEITYIFSAGPPPEPALCCGDANGSGDVDIDDVVYLITYIFGGGPPPVDAC